MSEKSKQYGPEFFKANDQWQRFKVRLHLHRIAGGVPRNPDIIAAWIDAKHPGTPEEKATLTAETLEQVKTDLEDNKTIGFKQDEHGLFIEGRQIKAMLKEAANICKEIIGLTAAKSKLAERVYVEDDRCHLGREKPDGTNPHVVHAMTMQGPRTSLRNVEYVDNAEITFTIRILRDTGAKSKVTVAQVAELLRYAQTNGLGACRSQGYGQFDVVEFTEI